MRILTLVTVSLSLFGAHAQAGVCGNLIKSGLFWTGQLRGKPYMQDNLPIADQELTKHIHDDLGLARAWLLRDFDTRNRGRDLGGGIAGIALNYQVNLEKADFVVTVPNWKQLTNAQLMSLVSLFDLIKFATDPDMASMFMETDEQRDSFVSGRKSLLQAVELWEKSFPNAPIPVALRASIFRVSAK